MPKKRFKRNKIKKRLFTKNRFIILNEDTFEEIFSLRLTLMNVFVVATLGAILLIFITTVIIAFTPLREFIPGYASADLKRNATQLALKSDSLEVALQRNEAYISSVKKVLLGEVEVHKFNKDSLIAAEQQPLETDLKPTNDELKLREKVAKEDKFNLFDKAKAKVSIVLFPPVKGVVTSKFNPKEEHYGIDVAVAKNTPIKAAYNGNVIFAEWTPTNGNVIILRHNYGYISVYKHAASLTKEQGDIVKTGEVIALAGAGGQESQNSQLHFELFKDGHPIDPSKFIIFE